MHIEQKVNIHNRFDVEVNGKWVGYAENIVLDSMWSRLCNGQAYFVNIHFGTGAGTLSAARTSLFTHLGSKTAVNEEQIKAIPVSKWKQKIVLNPEEYVNSILTEVGIAYGSTAGYLLTHAMLKDAEGNPISITKTDTDIVTIYATVFVTFGDGVDLISLPSSNILINYLVGGAAAPTGAFTLGESSLNTSGALQGVQSKPLGSSASATWTSDVPNKKRKTNVIRFGTTLGNGHVTEFVFANLFRSKLPSSFFSGQPYDNVAVGTGDGTKTKFELPSKNIRQSTLVVKVNGITAGDYTKAVIGKGPKYEMLSYRTVAPNAPVINIAVSKDAKRLVVSGRGSATYLNLFERTEDTGFCASRIFNPATGDSSYAWINMVFSPDGSTIMMKDEGYSTIKIFDIGESVITERPMPVTTGPTYVHYSLSGDGKRLVLSSTASPIANKHRVFDWNGSSWTEQPEVPWGGASLNDISEDGNTVVVGLSASPWFRVYDLVLNTWTARPDPVSPPSAGAGQLLLNYLADGLTFKYNANTAPYFEYYDWTGSVWVKRPAHTAVESFQKYEIASDRLGQRIAMPGENPPYMILLEWDGVQWNRVTSALFNKNLGGRGCIGTNLLCTPNGTDSIPAVFLFEPSITEITFTTPPANGAAITADYTVEGVHKTDQYVIDVSFAIQFGEGV